MQFLTPLPRLEPVTLTGAHARLEPLSLDHHDALRGAVADGRLWELWYTTIPSPEAMRGEIERRLALRDAGTMLPFAVKDIASGEIVGMTSFMAIDRVNRRLEIGSTWIAGRVQRGPLNTECKLMLVTHAFDELGCIAVEWRTHFMNQQSRRAIERLGAKLDGVLRSHLIMANGTVRDTAVYSVTAAEWPAVRANLRWQLDKPR
jgi:RimJ/RimL family protein N-acetyltransferase